MQAAKEVVENNQGVPDEARIARKSIRALTSLLLKRTYDMFIGDYGQRIPVDEEAERRKIFSKVSGIACPFKKCYVMTKKAKTINDNVINSSTDRR
jgi:hypothetical protein